MLSNHTRTDKDMSAEDLDKFFRDKLHNRPVAPSNEAWERLQARMQPAAPQMERKPLTMWYYSAAAAVTLLLGAGFWVARDEVSPLQPNATVATVQKPAAATPTPSEAAYPAAGQQQQTAAAAEVPADFSGSASVGKAQNSQHLATVTEKEKKYSPQATAEKSPASIISKGTKTTTKMPRTTFTPDAPADAMASAQPKASVTESATDPKAETLEIIVKLDNNQHSAVAMAPAEEAAASPSESARAGTGKVLKGIFKQVKNLRDGEKVNLAELGISKHTFALETNIGHKKISKTIEL